MAEQQQQGKVIDWSLLQRILIFARPYRKRLYWSLSLAVLLAVLSPIRPWLIQVTLQEGLRSDGNWAWFHEPAQLIIWITLIQLGLLLVETAARFVFSFFTASVGQHVVRDLRQTTYQKILSLHLRQFDRTPIGTLTTRTINDIESVNDIFSDGLIPILADMLSIVSILTYMFWTDWSLTLVCLAPFPLLILATYYFKEAVNRSFQQVRNAVAALNAFVQERLSGMAVVQAFGAEAKEQRAFTQINRDHRDANIKAIFAYSVFFPVVELVLAVSLGLLVWHAGSHADAAVAGKITAFILCLNLLFRPLRVIADKFNVLQMGMIASGRIFQVLDNPDVTADIVAPQDPARRMQGAIQFRDVQFGYLPESLVLKGLTLDVKPGEILALVGNTGSGKTTIISLLNRLYEPNAGVIAIDGKSIAEYPLEELRSQIAVVLQEVFLFSGSIYDNVTLRNPSITREQVEAAAQAIGIHDFITTLPGGYDFVLAERGANLSAGQRQLLAFVRALLYNPAILVLDEATASVDTESELTIQHAIDTLIAGRTSVIIAHRLSTIRKATQIVVLEHGQVKEQGSHDELLQKNGHYARLYRMQFAEKTVV
jgi:ATP-binding cassette subfamily B multidrug efflux pump